MEIAADLRRGELEAALPNRALRVYPALLSTESDALSWARRGAPHGAVVVSDYQASPRGRAGLEWTVVPGRSLGFSLVLRPRLSASREGWFYTVAALGLAEALDQKALIEWPDTIYRGERRIAAVGVHAELGPQSVQWAVVNAVILDASRPRHALLARAVEGIEIKLSAAPDALLADYIQRCRTLGKRVRARLIPMGPAGPEVSGEAVGSTMDGSLVVATGGGQRILVRPQNLGLLDHL